MQNKKITEKSKFNFTQLLSPIYWENQSLLFRIIISFGIEILGQMLLFYVYIKMGLYVTSLMILTSFIIFIFGGQNIGIAVMIFNILLADYFYIKPIGKLFVSSEALVRDLSSMLVMICLGLLFNIVTKMNKKALQEKTVADRLKEKALQEKAVADKVKEETLEAKAVADRVKEEALEAKAIADKVKEEALEAKAIADKVKEEALKAKAVADKAIQDRDTMIGVILSTP